MWPKPCSQKERETVSDACLHLSHVGLFTSPSLSRCPFNWRCPVSIPDNILSWILLRLSNFPTFLQRVFKKALNLLLSTYRLPMFHMFSTCPVPDNLPGNQVLLVDVRSLVWPVHQLFHFHQFPCLLTPIPAGACYVLPVLSWIDGSPRLILNLSGSW